MVSQFEVLTGIWVLTTALLLVVHLTDDRREATTQGIILAAGRSILTAFVAVGVPTIVVLGMDAITPLTDPRGRTLPGYFGDVAAVIAAATGLYVAYLSRYHQSTADDGAILSGAGQRTTLQIIGTGMAAAGLAAGFL
ncbi:hypothetical protein [Natrarchaeobius oligotrophus]|uniref:Uncharacterized protein n=1 Tax=Natrarchaeobius chitinivorans TaxID=1679083 RepID=A0A3N6MZF1_NATCH|nr:hypothetical protein [Natrarchaeobius chitinivorans]RQH01912.1 hypothetical protein EA472_06295 [Natrarchaeobius chitinivorans]